MFQPFSPATVFPAMPIGPLTGGTVLEQIAAGPVIPPGGGPGLVWNFDFWGTVTTALAADTVDFVVLLGGLAGTSILDPGAHQVNSGGVANNASWRFRGKVAWRSSTVVASVAQLDLNFFPAVVQQQVQTLAGGAAGQLVLGVTPSDAAVSITVNGGDFSAGP